MKIKFINKIGHWLLRNFPYFFKRLFTSQNWTKEKWSRIKLGYKYSRSFQTYFQMTEAYNAHDLFEWIRCPIEVIWGQDDHILNIKQSAAWTSILPRADLTFSVKKKWGHFPYIDNPKEFTKFLINFKPGAKANTKAGRLKLSKLADLTIPPFVTVSSSSSPDSLLLFLEKMEKNTIFAIRSSAFTEDKIDQTNTGLNPSFLRVKKTDVLKHVNSLLKQGIDEIIIQEYIEPVVSGVAFVRNISMDIEFIPGHLENLVSGKVQPLTYSVSKMPGEWRRDTQDISKIVHLDRNFSLKALIRFLKQCHQTFHYFPSDIEWAWDGKRFFLLQIRPVGINYTWRRALTSTNIDEIFPTQVSNIVEIGQRRTAYTISRIYGAWDTRALEDHEPFTAVYKDASYINLDSLFSRFYDWGLPGWFLKQQIGGNVPKLRPNPLRFILNSWTLLKMHFFSRKVILQSETRFYKFEEELLNILKTKYFDESKKLDSLFNWYTRYLVFIAQYSILITLAITSSGGNWLGKPRTLYSRINPDTFPHRVYYETDPASPRKQTNIPPLKSMPKFGSFKLLWHYLGLPGLGGKYLEIREWFRDNNMRLFYHLHFAFKGTKYFKKHSAKRTIKGTFFQDSGENPRIQEHSFIIYPGKVQGYVGTEILIVDTLEPGHYLLYKQSKAIIARTGGRLSHGATLLRELKKPSAVSSNIPPIPKGKLVNYNNGKITLLN